jgi:hypothetical protein
MQTNDNRTAVGVNHPGADEWMAFLYDEIAPERKQELQSHLDQCATCEAQLNQWHNGMAALDEWKLPTMRRAKRRPLQAVAMLKWAAAIAVLLALGFALGRQTSASAKELALLKASVARLSEKIERENNRDAGSETVRLLSDYARLDEDRRVEDQRALALAIRTLDLKLSTLRTELETVAVNTQDSFQQTQEGISQLALAASEEPKSTH